MGGRKAKANKSWGMTFLSRSRPMILSEFVGKLGGPMGLSDLVKFMALLRVQEETSNL